MMEDITLSDRETNEERLYLYVKLQKSLSSILQHLDLSSTDQRPLASALHGKHVAAYVVDEVGSDVDNRIHVGFDFSAESPKGHVC